MLVSVVFKELAHLCVGLELEELRQGVRRLGLVILRNYQH